MPRISTVKKRPNPVFQIVMETDAVIRGELYPISAPQTVGNFIALSNGGFYDGLTFHRCIRDFIIQGGASANGELPYCITGEFEFNRFKPNRLAHEYGSLCMARAGHYNSASSQFYIVTTRDSRELNCLNGAYAVFGKVLEGMKIVEAISAVETGAEHIPLHPQVIRRIRVEAFGQDYPFQKLPPPATDVNLPKVKHRSRTKDSNDSTK